MIIFGSILGYILAGCLTFRWSAFLDPPVFHSGEWGMWDHTNLLLVCLCCTIAWPAVVVGLGCQVLVLSVIPKPEPEPRVLSESEKEIETLLQGDSLIDVHHEISQLKQER